MNKYAFVPASPFRGDADAIQAELDRLEKSHGSKTPELIVACARSERSILHPLIFDGTTAEQALERYRLDRARNLLVSIVIADEKGDPTPVRVNVRVTDAEGQRGWINIERPGAHEAAVQRVLRDMAALRRELEALQMYPRVVQALEEALAA